MLNGKSILLTGGTGSFGQAFVSRVFDLWPDIKRLVVFSRDELKQFEMLQTFSGPQYSALRFFLGDVRDQLRLVRALNGIDLVVHAAALKQVPAAEYNPMEFIKTNIIGAANLVEACIDTNVSQVVALSTDKAAAPVNLYGATKLCSDKLFVAANSYAGLGPNFSVVRYGNVFGSRGSVVPYFLKKAINGQIPITDPAMTRFTITLDEGIDLVLFAIHHLQGGEVLVPKIPSYRIMDLAEAIGPNCKKEIIGIRPGEKIHEEMFTESDSLNTFYFENRYVILPREVKSVADYYVEKFGAKYVPQGFSFNSGKNTEFLGIQQIRKLIIQHVDSTFEPI